MTVVENREKNRFEIDLGDAIAIADYIERNGVIIFTHTEVPIAYEGKGVGSLLVQSALDRAREKGLRVHPLCPFFRSWIDRHPEYNDLVAR